MPTGENSVALEIANMLYAVKDSLNNSAKSSSSRLGMILKGCEGVELSASETVL